MGVTKDQLKIFAWALSVVVTVVAFVAWAQLYDWELTTLSAYQFFPLFGLLAFSLMWSHYIVAALRKYSGHGAEVTKQYFQATSFVVLAAILLHPGILTWQLLQDGFGLPPFSYFDYTGSAMKTVILLGETSLLIFLAYELHRWFKDRSWWRYVQYLSDAAMFLIIIHSLRLGSHLQDGWFRGVWYFYAVTLVISLIYMYGPKAKETT